MLKPGTMGHTLYDSPYGFSQDRGSDISKSLFYGWIARSVVLIREELRRKCLSHMTPHDLEMM